MKKYPILFLILTALLVAQGQKRVFTEREQPIYDRIRTLRAVPDDKRGEVTRQAALDIRALPASAKNKMMLADSLANLSTEGDFGKQTLQEVATTLYIVLTEQAAASKTGM